MHDMLDLLICKGGNKDIYMCIYIYILLPPPPTPTPANSRPPLKNYPFHRESGYECGILCDHSHLPPLNSPAPLTCGVSSECQGTRRYETTSRDQRGKIQMFFSSTGACTAAKFPIANHHSQINTQLYSASLIRLI